MSEKFINVREVWSRPGDYGTVQVIGVTLRVISRREFKQTIKNARDVLQLPGVTHAIIDTDYNVAIQASGYNDACGLFSHVFTAEELAPYKGGVAK